jgi:glutamate racemase
MNPPDFSDVRLPVAIFDSGIGGLTVLHRALRVLPGESFVYYADTAHVPYGDKPVEDIRRYVMAAAQFLAELPVKALVIACNTATSTSAGLLRETYPFPIIGMEPAVKPAVETSSGKRVLVLATRLTLKEKKFRELVERVDNDNIVDILAFPELVTLAEAFRMEAEDVQPVLTRTLAGVDVSQYGTVVLGCTHFPYFRKHIGAFFPGAEIIDGTEGTVNHLKNTLEAQSLLRDSGRPRPLRCFNSGVAADAARFLRYLHFLDQE